MTPISISRSKARCGARSAPRDSAAPRPAASLSKRAFITSLFIHSWNEFFFALLVLSDPAKQTLPLGIALFPGQYTMPWGEIAAASTIATLPLVALTLMFQRRIVQGLSAGAVKG